MVGTNECIRVWPGSCSVHTLSTLCKWWIKCTTGFVMLSSVMVYNLKSCNLYYNATGSPVVPCCSTAPAPSHLHCRCSSWDIISTLFLSRFVTVSLKLLFFRRNWRQGANAVLGASAAELSYLLVQIPLSGANRWEFLGCWCPIVVIIHQCERGSCGVTECFQSDYSRRGGW